MYCNYYDKSIDLAWSILHNLRKEYPRLSGLFFWKNLLVYLGMDEKMFNPYRKTLLSEKKYKQLFDKLSKFNNKLFVKWLLTK